VATWPAASPMHRSGPSRTQTETRFAHRSAQPSLEPQPPARIPGHPRGASRYQPPPFRQRSSATPKPHPWINPTRYHTNSSHLRSQTSALIRATVATRMLGRKAAGIARTVRVIMPNIPAAKSAASTTTGPRRLAATPARLALWCDRPTTPNTRRRAAIDDGAQPFAQHLVRTAVTTRGRASSHRKRGWSGWSPIATDSARSEPGSFFGRRGHEQAILL
jgi:hypothetical protein